MRAYRIRKTANCLDQWADRLVPFPVAFSTQLLSTGLKISRGHLTRCTSSLLVIFPCIYMFCVCPSVPVCVSSTTTAELAFGICSTEIRIVKNVSTIWHSESKNVFTVCVVKRNRKFRWHLLFGTQLSSFF